MFRFKRTILSALTFALLGITACSAASLTPVFELVTTEVSQGPSAEFSVRVVDKASGKPITDATIESVSLDMGPDGMAGMKETAEMLSPSEPGTFRFRTNLSMEGRWAVHLKGKLKDGTAVTGDLVLTATAKKADAVPESGRKIAYYRNPMGLPDRSDVPKKDSMGMDYIPVYEDEASEPKGTVSISPARIQRAGVRTETAQLRRLHRSVRAPAVAVIDERTMRDVTLRADGFIEKLYVAEEGKHVAAGEPLFRVYSPDVVNAGVDLRTARGAARGTDVGISGAIQRLENLDVPKSFIDDLKTHTSGAMPTQFDWPAPVSGVVMEKNIVEGQKASAGTLLYRIADLSKIWVVANVSEQDIGLVEKGAMASIVFRAYPNDVYKAPVTFILHELDAATRTAKVRIEVANPDHRILHDMFADVTIETGGDDKLLSVPLSSVIDTGERQIVLVDKGEGRFEQRPVSLGLRTGNYVEIRDGLADGENVVTTAAFLIDSESNLRAALSSFDAPASSGRAEKATP